MTLSPLRRLLADIARRLQTPDVPPTPPQPSPEALIAAVHETRRELEAAAARLAEIDGIYEAENRQVEQARSAHRRAVDAARRALDEVLAAPEDEPARAVAAE